MLKADLSDSFVSIRYLGLWKVLRERVGPSSAGAFMKAVTGRGVIPEWMAIPGKIMPMHAGCKQCAPENPVLGNLLRDEAPGPVLEEWQRSGVAICVHGPGAERYGAGNAVRWIHLLAYAGDLVLPARSDA